MSFLRDAIKQLRENAAGGATGAGSVAGFQGHLFGGKPIQRNKKPKRLKKQQNLWNWHIIGEAEEKTYSPADVLSKLDAAEQYSRKAKDTIPFGLEDGDGNIIKVLVPVEQAEEFEHALAVLLSNTRDDNETTNIEIAEILYELKDRFSIVDVVWPKIYGDVEEDEEEEGQPAEGGEEIEDIELDLEGGDEQQPDEGGEMEAEPTSTEPAGGDDVRSTLNQIVDLLKAQAEATKAQAEAEAAKAEADAARASAMAAASKVKQEEEILDMETYYKEKREKDKEAKTLADLAKFRHDKATDIEASAAAGEAVSKEELMQKILDYLRTTK